MKTGEERATYLHAVCPGESYSWHDKGSDVPAWTVIVDTDTGIAFTVANVWIHEDHRIPRLIVAEFLDAGIIP